MEITAQHVTVTGNISDTFKNEVYTNFTDDEYNFLFFLKSSLKIRNLI